MDHHLAAEEEALPAWAAPPGGAPAMPPASPAPPVLVHLRLDEIAVPGDNIRGALDLTPEFVESVRLHGILEPLLVEPPDAGAPGPYRLAAGFRRHGAALQAGLESVPAIVRSATPTTRLERMLIENLQRQDVSPVDEGRAYRRLCDLGLSQREVARQVGRSQSHVSRRLAILQLPGDVHERLASGRWSVEEAERLIPLRAHPERVSTVVKEVERNQWARGNLGRLVELELAEQRNAEARAAARARAIAEHPEVRLVEAQWHSATGAWGAMTGGSAARPLGGGLDRVPVPEKRHAKEKCHALAICHNGDLVPVCLDPKRHARPAEKGAAVTAAEERREAIAAGKRRRADTERRLPVLRDLIRRVDAGTVPAVREAMLSVCAALLEEMSGQKPVLETMFELLELDVEALRKRWADDGGGFDRWGALRSWAQLGDGELARAAFALSLVPGELLLRTGEGWRGHERIRGALTRAGYEFSREETETLARAYPDDDAAETANEEAQS